MSDIESNPSPAPSTVAESVLGTLSEVINKEEKTESLLENLSEQIFVDIVKKSLENEDIKNKITIKLNVDVIKIINNIITLSPNTLTDIEKAIVEIVKDGKIDSKDIPNLIVVIQRIYQFIYSIKSLKFDSKKRSEITSTSLKFFLHLLVLERKIKIDEDKEVEFLTQTDNLIDSCISLLSYSKSLRIKGCIKFH